MFDSLDEQMKLDDRKETNSRDKLIRWGVTGIGAILVFGGLYLAIHLLQG
jgi:hypothetical protein